MSRLTKYIVGYAHGKPGRTIEQAMQSDNYCRGEFDATGLVDKLAQYEDIGEPSELRKVTFCRDCRYRYMDWGCAHEKWDCEGQYHSTKDYDFCSYGEPREERENEL